MLTQFAIIMSQWLIFVCFFSLLRWVFFISSHCLSRYLWGKNYLSILWCVSSVSSSATLGNMRHIQKGSSLNLKCVSHGRPASLRLYQCYYSHCQIWRKKKNNNKRLLQLNFHGLHSPLTFIYSVRFDCNSNCKTFSIFPSP